MASSMQNPGVGTSKLYTIWTWNLPTTARPMKAGEKKPALDSVGHTLDVRPLLRSRT